jgi:hypothetical protein
MLKLVMYTTGVLMYNFVDISTNIHSNIAVQFN